MPWSFGQLRRQCIVIGVFKKISYHSIQNGSNLCILQRNNNIMSSSILKTKQEKAHGLDEDIVCYSS